MSMPVGHPDYQDYANWRSTPILAESITVTSTSPVAVGAYITNYSSLHCGLFVNSGVGVTVTVQFWKDDTQTYAVGAQQWVVTEGVGLNCVTPAMADYVVVTISTSEAGDQVCGTFFEPTNVAATSVLYIQTGNTVSEYDVSIGAGDSLTLLMPQVMEGSGYLAIESTETSSVSNVIVNQLGENGNPNARIAQSNDIGADFSTTFQTSVGPVQIIVENTGAAAFNYYIYCNVLGV